MGVIIDWKDVSISPEGEYLTGDNAIAQALLNVVSVSPGELLFNPEFGCDLEALLFEAIDELTTFSLREELIRCLSFWDPRARIVWSESTVVPVEDENKYECNLVIQIMGKDENYRFSFVLNKLNSE